jgi:quercetin dioxygenase-like cupin family protein
MYVCLYVSYMPFVLCTHVNMSQWFGEKGKNDKKGNIIRFPSPPHIDTLTHTHTLFCQILVGIDGKIAFGLVTIITFDDGLCTYDARKGKT